MYELKEIFRTGPARPVLVGGTISRVECAALEANLYLTGFICGALAALALIGSGLTLGYVL